MERQKEGGFWAPPKRAPTGPGLLLTLLVVLTVIDDVFSKVIFQVIEVLIVFLADVFLDSIVCPADIPCGSPWSTVGARIINRRLVVESALIGTRPPFRQMHLVGVEMTEI